MILLCWRYHYIVANSVSNLCNVHLPQSVECLDINRYQQINRLATTLSLSFMPWIKSLHAVLRYFWYRSINLLLHEFCIGRNSNCLSGRTVITEPKCCTWHISFRMCEKSSWEVVFHPVTIAFCHIKTSFYFCHRARCKKCDVSFPFFFSPSRRMFETLLGGRAASRD